MAKVHAGGGVQKTTQNQNYSVDTNTAGQLGQIHNAAVAAGAAGPGALLNGAGQYGTAAQTAGQTGLAAASGDPNALKGLMDPYTQSVIDANNANLAKTNAQGTNVLNAQATAANAFGGSRQGVAQGVMLSNNAMQNQALNAGLLNNQYNNAVQQGNNLAGLGFQGAQLNSNLGFGGVGNGLWNLNALRQGYIQPTGGTSGGATTTANGNFSSSFGIG